MYISRKASTRVFAGVVLAAFFISGMPLAASAATPSPGPAAPLSSDAKAPLTDRSPDPAIDAMFPYDETQMATLDQPLTDIMNSFPGIVGKSAWHNDSMTATMDYYTGADPSEEAAFLAAAARIVAPSPLKFEWVPVSWSLRARGALLQKITANPEAWISFFGSAPESGYIDESGKIHVSLADRSRVSSSPARSGVLPDGTPFIADPPSSVDWQVGRTSDVSP